jgi:phage major head subunit gpT-like protein
VITPAGLSVFLTNVNTMWGEVFSSLSVDSVAAQIASTIPVSGEQFTMGWTGMMPKARIWAGSRHVHEPAPQLYTVVPRPYELTYSIDRFKLDDDIFGLYYRELPDMARQLKRWPDYELRDLLEASGAYSDAVSQAGLDGLANWSTAHPVDLYDATKGTYINDFTGGGQNISYPKTGGGTVTTLVGGALTPTSFTTLWEYMSTLKGEDNEPLGVTADCLMHAPQLKAEVELILRSTFFAPPQWGVNITSQVGAADNPLKRFGVRSIENKFLKNIYTWYLMDTSAAMKPFTWALREAPVIVPRMNEADPVVFDTHHFLWGAWMRAAPAWSFAFLAARSGPS